MIKISKYELTKDKLEINGITHYRIRALRDIHTIDGDVKRGELGGYVASHENLLNSGDCWVFPDAIVTDQAVVKHSAIVKGNAIIAGMASIENKSIVQGSAIVCANATIKNRSIIGGTAEIGGSIIVESSIIAQNQKVGCITFNREKIKKNEQN